MMHVGFIKQKLKDLETCPREEISRHCVAILESYIFLERAEQKSVAEEFYKWAQTFALHKPLLYCYAKYMKGFDLFYREHYEQALPLITEAQNLFAEQKEDGAVAMCTIVQGNIYRTMGDVDLALKLSWAGHEQILKFPVFEVYLLACKLNIGGIYVEMKHYEEAIPLFRSVLEMAGPKEKYYWTIYALHGLGKIYLAQRNFPLAKDCFVKALGDAEKYSNPTSLCNSLSEMGSYFSMAEDFAEAEKFHSQALAKREQNNFTGGAITSCIRLGEIFVKQQRYDEAIAVLGKGLKMAEQIQVKPKIYQIHFMLSQIFESKGELEKGLLHYKQFHELREQVEIEDSARKIKNAQMVFEAEQTKKENTIIKKQKEEIERKNVELQETIDELTRARAGKRARALTLIIAIVLFVAEDPILHYALLVAGDNYFVSTAVKIAIIFSLSPINKVIENYLLRKVMKKEEKKVLV
jgi:tetratricopeptide (TPR) repeat protein